MKALTALAFLAAFVVFGPCKPADPSGANTIVPHPPKAFPLAGFGMCIDDGYLQSGNIIYRVLKCELGAVLVPMRYAPVPNPYTKPQLEAKR